MSSRGKNLRIMKAKKIYESPDIISLPNLEYNEYGEDIYSNIWSPEFGDDDSYPFWLNDGELIIGKSRDSHPENMQRSSETIPGRIWTERK